MPERNENRVQQTLQQTIDAVVQEPLELSIDIKRGAVGRWLQRRHILPAQYKLMIRPATLGTLMLVSRKLLTIDVTPLLGGAVLNANYTLAGEHAVTVAEIVAQAAHNRPGKPPRRLVRFILDHFTQGELVAVLSAVLRQLDIQCFMISIASIRGLNVMAASPTEQVETIAPGTSSEAL